MARDRFRSVRARSLALAAPLSDADATAQSMPDASPAKWHLAHTSWFFETFVLRDHVPGYRLFDERFGFLFNSYYEAIGPRQPRARRGLLTRPKLSTVLAYRAHVDAAVEAALCSLSTAALSLVELGLNHEEQHQELLLTDVLHLFAQNPLRPAYAPDAPSSAACAEIDAEDWVEHPGGIVAVGHTGDHDGDNFAFDCEMPQHDVLLPPFRLAPRLVTNGDWLAFIADGGYRQPSLWLADGWAWVQAEAIEAPLYWQQHEDQWSTFTLSGPHPVDPAAPVTHVSFYEADAFATWAGERLPREAEWEAMARMYPDLPQLFGACWQWTASAYLAYPGFRPAPGAVGEYNGKFMAGQFVLRGGSCATPPGHSRPSYRNFFYPHQRWQFTGVRLARDGV